MTDKILIAKISSTHGLKGQLKIMSFSQNPEDVATYQPLFDKNNQEFKIKIVSKPQGKNNDVFIVNVEGITNKNDAELLRNTDLFINKDQLKEADDGEFYYADLIGLDVLDAHKNKIGKVKDVMNYGAGDIIEIEFNKSAKQKEAVQMFSFRDEIFPEINLDAGFIQIIFPEIVEIND